MTDLTKRLAAEGESRSGVQSVERAIRLLECLASSRQPQTMQSLAEAIGCSPSTAHRIAVTLARSELLHFDPRTKHYSLGAGLTRLAQQRSHQMDLRALAREPMETLRRASHETVSLWLPARESKICIALTEGLHEIRQIVDIGTVAPLSDLSAGSRILLASMPHIDAERVVRNALAGQAAARSSESAAGGTRGGDTSTRVTRAGETRASEARASETRDSETRDSEARASEASVEAPMGSSEAGEPDLGDASASGSRASEASVEAPMGSSEAGEPDVGDTSAGEASVEAPMGSSEAGEPDLGDASAGHSVDDIMREIDAIRGGAVCLLPGGENLLHPEIATMAAAVRDGSGSIVAAMVIAGPARRFTIEVMSEARAQLEEAAGTISAAMGAPRTASDR